MVIAFRLILADPSLAKGTEVHSGLCTKTGLVIYLAFLAKVAIHYYIVLTVFKKQCQDTVAKFISGTGKYLSEAFIFASTNPQYDDRLFIELQVQYREIPSMLCTDIVSDIQNNFCTQHVLPMFCKKKSF